MVNENYYCHVLINYTPIVMQETFDKFGVGLCIFSMKGIEQRNKESKNCTSQFSNHKHNLCFLTIARLYDIFFFGGLISKEFNK